MRLFLLWVVGMAAFRHSAAYDSDFHKYEVFLKHSHFCVNKLVRKYYETTSLCETCSSTPASTLCTTTFHGPFSVVQGELGQTNNCDLTHPFITRHQSEFGIDLTDAHVFKSIVLTIPRISETWCSNLHSGGLTVYESSVKFFESKGHFAKYYGHHIPYLNSCFRLSTNIFIDKGFIAHEINETENTNWCEDESKYMLLSAQDKDVLESYVCNYKHTGVIRRDFPNKAVCLQCALSLELYVNQEGDIDPVCYQTEQQSGFTLTQIDAELPSQTINHCSDAIAHLFVHESTLNIDIAWTAEFPYILKRCGFGTDWINDVIFLHASQNVTRDFPDVEYRHCGHENYTLVHLTEIYHGNLLTSHCSGAAASGITTTTTAAPTTTTPRNATETLEAGQLAAGFIVAIALGLGVGALVIWEGVRRMRPVYFSLKAGQGIDTWQVA